MNNLLLFLAVLPGLGICYAMFRIDRYDREPLLALAVAFGLGAAVTVPAVWLEAWAFQWLGHQPGIIETLVLAFAGVALVEEGFKFFALRLGAFPFPFFNEPLDGIVYSVMVAMGFSTVESLAYADRFGLETVLLRAFTAVPAHLVFAIVLGYFVGSAKFDPARRTTLLWRGFGLTVLLHGLYDTLVIQQWFEWLAALATVGLYLCLFFCTQLVREHLENSPFSQRE